MKLNLPDFNNPIQAAQSWLKQAELIQELELNLEEAALVIIEYRDAFEKMKSSDKPKFVMSQTTLTYTVKEVADTISGMTNHKLNSLFRSHGYLNRHSESTYKYEVLEAGHKTGWFYQSVFTDRMNNKHQSIRITQKGMNEIPTWVAQVRQVPTVLFEVE